MYVGSSLKEGEEAEGTNSPGSNASERAAATAEVGEEEEAEGTDSPGSNASERAAATAEVREEGEEEKNRS